MVPEQQGKKMKGSQPPLQPGLAATQARKDWSPGFYGSFMGIKWIPILVKGVVLVVIVFGSQLFKIQAFFSSRESSAPHHLAALAQCTAVSCWEKPFPPSCGHSVPWASGWRWQALPFVPGEHCSSNPALFFFLLPNLLADQEVGAPAESPGFCPALLLLLLLPLPRVRGDLLGGRASQGDPPPLAMGSLPPPPPFAPNESSAAFLSRGWYDANQNLLLGILLAITGNILMSISLSLQKCSHLRLMHQANQKPCYRSKLWWSGIVLMGIGETGNFAAYGFAPVMVIAPLGSTAVIGSAVISVLYLKENIKSEGILGGTVTIAGTFLLVTFAPHVTQEADARKIQNDLVSWQFLIYVMTGIIAFCILLYFYKKREMKHIVLLLTMVALLASMTIISVKAVAVMITLSVEGDMQLAYPIFYVMLILMVVTCVFQVNFLNQAMKLYDAGEVIPMNYMFFTVSAILAGSIFYQEFKDTSLLSGFMFFFGCFLSFVGVFILSRNRGKECLTSFYIDYGHIPGKKMKHKIQPNSLSYGSLYNDGDSVKTQS